MRITPYTRKSLESNLKGETLSRVGLLSGQEGIIPLRIAPEVSVVKIGGHGVIDYGSSAVHPLVCEIRDLVHDFPMLIMTGGGARVRHVMDIGLDLGMPTGVLASLAGKISEQNALMLSILLADVGGQSISTSDILEVPNLLRQGVLPVTQGTPPFGLFEVPPEKGMLPQYRTDCGALIAAEVLGAKACILVKNTAGLFDKNPFIYPDAELIPSITTTELMDLNMDDMVMEHKAVEILAHCKNLHEVRIVNGHNPGELTAVLREGKAGTVIRRG
ncbi:MULTISPECIES: amino acid kinase family protein [Methanocorpusculum]|jgi:molybdenum storage protein|uniref:amino acid kinase family protein n=1 Tax=Methanocorpusculum TaxID=2192 RepID=UPI0005B251D7|nr:MULTISPECIES: uridylate kinase [Methanocorpusculum]MDD2803586.1 uridylate kinase [Methanocorpusculum sp.]NLC91492.1 uridylate kinase [Methanocorpusculum parvum]MDD3047619.1 uridylate kinase [Methanocorpusculum sp.]MDD3912669.1 uridylate kinase [Methanocorpusculum sp.]HJJ35512.1 uridylate kinase [Methanocorpusculum sp.]